MTVLTAMTKTIPDFCCLHRLLYFGRFSTATRLFHFSATYNNDEIPTESKPEGEEEFRVYKIEGVVRDDVQMRKKRIMRRMPTPRYRSMSPDQDWTDVWPTASTFKWSAVPFPVRQGFIKSSSENKGVVPSKYANLELMKIPNFLHLTPAHIKKHCAAIKKFCSEWPEGLESDEQCRVNFPLESITSDFVFSGPSVSDDRARVAVIKVHLSDLELDYHARDKFIRIAGDRYNEHTDEVTFESDKCPLKSQNMEYVKFLLTATYFESWKRESWEDLKELNDMEKYFWDINASKETVISLLRQIRSADDVAVSPEGCLNYLPSNISDEDALCHLPELENYKAAVEELFNEGENIETLSNYKDSVKALLNLKSDASLS